MFLSFLLQSTLGVGRAQPPAAFDGKTRLLALVLLLCACACHARTPRDLTIDYMCLYYAARGGDELLVTALLERGAPVNLPDADSDMSYPASLSDSPLQAAAEGGYAEIVELLLKHKPWVDHRCCDTPAALGMASSKGHLKIVEMLLAAGADPTITSHYGRKLGSGTPLDAARAAGHKDVVRILEAALKARK